MFEGFLCYNTICNRKPLAVQCIGPYHNTARFCRKWFTFPFPRPIHIASILQLDRQTGQEFFYAFVFVFADNFNENSCTCAFNTTQIPQAGRPPIVAFCFETVNAANINHIISIIDCIFIFIKSITGEVITERIRFFHCNTNLRSNFASFSAFFWNRHVDFGGCFVIVKVIFFIDPAILIIICQIPKSCVYGLSIFDFCSLSFSLFATSGKAKNHRCR